MKRLKKNTIFKGGVLVIFLLSFCSCSKSTDYNENKYISSIVVGVEGTYAPFNWIQTFPSENSYPLSDGTYLAGYDVMIGNMLSEKIGKEIEYEIIEWDGLLPALTSGKVDLIMSGITPLEERKVSIDFTDNYYCSEISIVVLKDSKYSNARKIADLENIKITGQINTFPYSLLNQIPNADIKPALEDFPTIIMALQSGKIDGYICEKTVALSATYYDSNMVCLALDDQFDYAPINTSSSIGIKKQSPLLDIINQALSEITQEERNQMMDEAIMEQANIR